MLLLLFSSFSSQFLRFIISYKFLLKCDKVCYNLCMAYKAFLVGGAVRDHLLGIDSQDRDYVVVGATPQELEAQGFKQVGQTFPVYLHPTTGDEYALARREKKVAPGYGGFKVDFGPEVTLEEDLSRRDLTINAMAMTDNFQVIDPYNGYADLTAGVLRHVSEAFSEDPLRVLRVARFVARYGFEVAPETEELCAKLVASGELDFLAPDRFWKEFSRMLGEEFFNLGLQFLVRIKADTKVPYLATLLLDAGFAGRSVFFNRRLTTVERALFFTAMTKLNQKQLDELRVPNDLSNAVKRIAAFDNLFHNWKMLSDDLDAALVFVDRNRDHLKSDAFRTELRNFVDLMPMSNSRTIFLDQLLAAADAIFAVNFADLVAGVPKAQIKDVVKTAKLNELRRVFA